MDRWTYVPGNTGLAAAGNNTRERLKANSDGERKAVGSSIPPGQIKVTIPWNKPNPLPATTWVRGKGPPSSVTPNYGFRPELFDATHVSAGTKLTLAASLPLPVPTPAPLPMSAAAEAEAARASASAAITEMYAQMQLPLHAELTTTARAPGGGGAGVASSSKATPAARAGSEGHHTGARKGASSASARGGAGGAPIGGRSTSASGGGADQSSSCAGGGGGVQRHAAVVTRSPHKATEPWRPEYVVATGMVPWRPTAGAPRTAARAGTAGLPRPRAWVPAGTEFLEKAARIAGGSELASAVGSPRRARAPARGVPAAPSPLLVKKKVAGKKKKASRTGRPQQGGARGGEDTEAASCCAHDHEYTHGPWYGTSHDHGAERPPPQGGGDGKPKAARVGGRSAPPPLPSRPDFSAIRERSAASTAVLAAMAPSEEAGGAAGAGGSPLSVAQLQECVGKAAVAAVEAVAVCDGTARKLFHAGAPAQLPAQAQPASESLNRGCAAAREPAPAPAATTGARGHHSSWGEWHSVLQSGQTAVAVASGPTPAPAAPVAASEQQKEQRHATAADVGTLSDQAGGQWQRLRGHAPPEAATARAHAAASQAQPQPRPQPTIIIVPSTLQHAARLAGSSPSSWSGPAAAARREQATQTSAAKAATTATAAPGKAAGVSAPLLPPLPRFFKSLMIDEPLLLSAEQSRAGGACSSYSDAADHDRRGPSFSPSPPSVSSLDSVAELWELERLVEAQHQQLVKQGLIPGDPTGATPHASSGGGAAAVTSTPGFGLSGLGFDSPPDSLSSLDSNGSWEAGLRKLGLLPSMLS
ncbi:hypothetical protein FOA52_012253 [Chlamydomonas sp. UWO 241]|nr:hypothetical protein FOA52_012253 [Chlamydomonas sp. UWO 241]